MVAYTYAYTTFSVVLDEYTNTFACITFIGEREIQNGQSDEKALSRTLAHRSKHKLR